jgi:hypothetical protein
VYSSQLAELVAEAVRAQFTMLVQTGFAKRNALWFTTGLIVPSNGDNLYRELCHAPFGDENLAAEYQAYALGKARLTAREGLPSGTIIDLHPDRLRPGDVCYRGGYVLPGSLIVCAVSGIQSRFDESLSAAGCAFGVAVAGLATDEARGATAASTSGFFPETTLTAFLARCHTVD